MNRETRSRPAIISAHSGMADLVDRLIRRLQAGEAIDPDEAGAGDPALADQVRRLLPTLERLADLGHSVGSGDEPGPRADGGPCAVLGLLGDFRLIREIGRGGMGVVYEAEQLSLRRRVALKVLPFAAVTDPRQLQRFQLEAQAAAQLHHTHIVPVYAVGCERGVHYYAMQFIEGDTLAQVIQELRRLDAPGGGPASELTESLASGRLVADRVGSVAETPTAPHVPAAPDGPASDPSPPSPTRADSSTTRGRAFFRNVAQLGIQAAEALEQAHQQGILHRDIKPSNLLIDARGHLWVTDFGLARLQSEASLTITGDLLGTLRYMSPEQALAKRVVIDHRTDLYSLGATLYELATLHPVFEGDDRQELLRQIAFAEPRPLRKVNPAVPRELETIVLKALAKDPDGRYASAQELADDLERFLEDRPIRAKRPTLRERAAKWSRRHTAVVYSALLFLMLAVAGLSVGIVLIARAAEKLRRQDYVNRIALALSAVQEENVPLAEDLLQGCPVDLRGWEWNYVNRLAHLERRTYWGHRHYLASPRFGQSVECLAYSPNGSWIASGAGHALGQARATDTAEIRLWEPDTGRDRRILSGLPGTVQSVAISPDGTRLAAGGGSYEPRVEGWLTVWDAATGKQLWTRYESDATVMSIAFSPDGKSLVAGYGLCYSRATGHARLWDVATPKEVGEKFAEVGGGVNSVAFHPDSRRVALTGFGHVEIWDVVNRDRPLFDLSGHTKWVTCAAFSPDGRWLATGAWDTTIRLWDLTTGTEVRPLYGHKSFVRGVAFSPDGTLLASVSEGRDVRLWDAATGLELATFHGHSSFNFAVAFHPDGRRIASGGADGTVKIWDVVRSRPVVCRGHSGYVTHVAFHRLGSRLASETARNQYRTGDETIRVWDPWTGEHDPIPDGVSTITDLGPEFGPGGKFVDGWPDRGRQVTSPDGRRTAIFALGASEDSVVLIKDAETDRVLTTLRGNIGPIGCIAFSHDGTRIATAGQDHTIKIWDAEDGRDLLTLRGHTHVVQCVTFSPVGALLASGGIDTTVRIWDATPFSPHDLHEQEARRIVFPLYPWTYQFKDEMIERLRVDTTRDAAVRATAIALLETLADDPEQLDHASWQFVRTPGGHRDDYVRALHRAEAAVRLAPRNGPYLRTLGVALYRVGRDEEALETLRRAAALDTAQHGGPTPIGLAFLAMTHHRLDDHDAARSYREQLRALRAAKSARWTDDPDAEEAFREAEALIGPGPALAEG